MVIGHITAWLPMSFNFHPTCGLGGYMNPSPVLARVNSNDHGDESPIVLHHAHVQSPRFCIPGTALTVYAVRDLTCGL